MTIITRNPSLLGSSRRINMLAYVFVFTPLAWVGLLACAVAAVGAYAAVESERDKGVLRGLAFFYGSLIQLSLGELEGSGRRSYRLALSGGRTQRVHLIAHKCTYSYLCPCLC